MAKYMGRMANSGKVCTLIMMVMKAMYSRTLMKPGGGQQLVTGSVWGRRRGARGQPAVTPGPLTSEQLRVEHVHGLVVPGVLALQVH